MELRETKILPIPDGKWSVEMTYSDHQDELKAAHYLKFRTVLAAKPKHPVALYQREAVTELYSWMQVEIERLRVAAF